MSDPLVSILWVNYNSKRIINVVKKSLKSVKDVNYDNYELIIVDNASTDGSFEIIKSYLNEINLKAKLIKNKRNLGFTGGNNVAYMARDPNAKYIVLLNNDAIIYPDSIKKLVDFLEKHPKAGACQGIILRLNKEIIHSGGGAIDEFLFSHHIYGGVNYHEFVYKKESYYSSYADGSFSMYRVEALKKIDSVPFSWEMFAYFDDNVLGLRLWNADYTVNVIPEVVGEHLWRGTFRTASMPSLTYYYWVRGWAALFTLSNSFIKKSSFADLMILLRLLQRYIFWFFKEIHSLEPLIKGIKDGIEIGIRMSNKKGFIDIYKAPLLRRSLAIRKISLFSPLFPHGNVFPDDLVFIKK